MATEEIVESRPKSSRHYSSGAPWLFRGSALYQLHLVKSEIARAFIPKELRLVEAFGYTLGGLFLACYEDSPAGAFDELVVISGIVWNPPTSCAWAARVLVNSEEACRHGRKEVGLPSQVAIFSERINRSLEKRADISRGFLGFHGIGSYFCNPKESSELQITEIHGSTKAALCSIALPFSGPAPIERWTGPKIRMSLPSFSGKTKYNPSLLKYSCQIECRFAADYLSVFTAICLSFSRRVQTVEPAKLSATTSDNMESILDHQNTEGGERGALSSENGSWNRCISILLSKPILALRFNCLKMLVHAPTHVLPPSNNGIREPS